MRFSVPLKFTMCKNSFLGHVVVLLLGTLSLSQAQQQTKASGQPSPMAGVLIQNNVSPAPPSAPDSTTKDFLEYSAAIREETKAHLERVENTITFTATCIGILLTISSVLVGVLGLKSYFDTLRRIESKSSEKLESLMDTRLEAFRTLVETRMTDIENKANEFEKLFKERKTGLLALELPGSSASTPGGLVANLPETAQPPVPPDKKGN